MKMLPYDVIAATHGSVEHLSAHPPERPCRMRNHRSLFHAMKRYRASNSDAADVDVFQGYARAELTKTLNRPSSSCKA